MTRKFAHIRPLTVAEEADIQRAIAGDRDAPEATDEELAQAKPFAEMFPDLAKTMRRAAGRPKADDPKRAISIRLDRDVIDKFKATGAGWQGRINDVLKNTKIG
jgi:uncharacterized protein (DUF4415 family)